MLELYRNIKRRREALGLSQEALARKVGYTNRSTVTRIENGEIDLPQSKILAFAHALRTTPAELVGWTDDDSYGDSVIYIEDLGEYAQEIVERVQLLSQGNQIALLGIINQLIEAQEEIKNDKGTRKSQSKTNRKHR